MKSFFKRNVCNFLGMNDENRHKTEQHPLITLTSAEPKDLDVFQPWVAIGSVQSNQRYCSRVCHKTESLLTFKNQNVCLRFFVSLLVQKRGRPVKRALSIPTQEVRQTISKAVVNPLGRA